MFESYVFKRFPGLAEGSGHTCGVALPAGTVEFMVDKHGGYYFLEVNPRIQVGAPAPKLYLKLCRALSKEAVDK